MKTLLKSFHLNGHTLGFHPQNLKSAPHLVQLNKQYHVKVLLRIFHLIFWQAGAARLNNQLIPC